MTQEPQKNNTVLILIAVIGVLGTIVATTIGVIGNYNIEKMRQEAELTQIALVSIATKSGATQIVLQNTANAPTEPPAPTYTPYPTETPKTDKIAGTWTGITNWNEIQGLQTTVSIKSGCIVGELCGTTRTDGGTYGCNGNLFLLRIDGDTFTFIQKDEQGNVPDGCPDGAIETIYLLPTGELSWNVARDTGTNQGTGSGILEQQ